MNAARCDHAESEWGRCASCGMTWTGQARARAARAQLAALRGAAYVAPLTDYDVLAIHAVYGAATPDETT